jgi:hypothetical protein
LAIKVMLDCFNLSFKPFPIFVDHYCDADEETFVAECVLPAIPSAASKHPPDLAVALTAEIAGERDLGWRVVGHFIGHVDGPPLALPRRPPLWRASAMAKRVV